MLTAGQFWLLVKALIAITPWIVTSIQSGRIRASSQEELKNAILKDMDARIVAAQAARDADDLTDPYMPDELRKQLREK